MITTEDQEKLFTLIASKIEKDISCIAIGGTAMMFSGYKQSTKDIDLIFQSNEDRNVFIKTLESLGYKKNSLANLYQKEKAEDKEKPLLYTRTDERFDLFVNNVFGMPVPLTDRFTQKHEFIDEHELNVFVLPKEDLILLKALTNRERDFDDIETIVKIEKIIDWDYIIKTAITHKNNKSWIVLNVEEMLRKLQKTTFIPQKYFDELYAA